MAMKILDRLANRLGYERKRPKIPGTLVFTSRLGTWRKDGHWDGDRLKIPKHWPSDYTGSTVNIPCQSTG